MASDGTKDPPESSLLADRTAAINNDQVDTKEVSKNALKKAQKQERLAADKANKSAVNTTKEAGRAEAKKAMSKAPKKKIEGAALIGIDVSKEEDFAAWYQQVLSKGDMLDYYDISGCYILKVDLTKSANGERLTLKQPASFFIWEEVQHFFNKKIKSIGVRNCSFPMFVSQDVLEREKAHIEGFATEVAWVTHA